MKRQTLLIAASAVVLLGSGALAAQQPGGHTGHAAPAAHAGHDGHAGHMTHHPDVGPHQPWHQALHAAVAAPTRTPANVARDPYRHPFETLAFFGVRPSDTVVEIWPGGGWYTEILAPYLRQGGGTYYAVGLNAAQLRRVNEWRTANAPLYGQARTAIFPSFAPGDARVPDGSADVVVTFRNVHNWRMGSRERPDYSVEAFRQMFAMLRPGGTLGIEEHRLPESADSAREAASGYLKVSTIRRLAEAAGFEFVGASEINANPRDTADYPEGVWTLPPTYTLGDRDRARYAAIGESDRMTLRFRRPLR